MANVGIVYHPQRESARTKAVELEKWLYQRDHRAIFVGESESWAEGGLDLVVSLGGDGTMLRAIDKILPATIPVLGVNFGSLGYLTEIDPDGLFRALERFFGGDYSIEERMTLSIEVEKDERAGEPQESQAPFQKRYVALNDLVVEKLDSGHVIRVDVTFGASHFLTYEADGLIVSTPTGSTAYSFSARGPVVSPRLKAIVLTPISPHMLFDRSLIVEPSEIVELKIAEGPPAAVMVDGSRKVVLEPDDRVRCSAAETAAHLVTFSRRDFHEILKRKFGLHSKRMGD
ncbi:MAG: NAD(+)/NADH kinase [Actinomycetota bacterium]|jgi:NAD+ kinase|nr:NAD(+)/NADH kinase [Actinomycetota bacterium]